MDPATIAFVFPDQAVAARPGANSRVTARTHAGAVNATYRPAAIVPANPIDHTMYGRTSDGASTVGRSSAGTVGGEMIGAVQSGALSFGTGRSPARMA
jgi:hypothetical protein